jgi:hypothetical protein
MLMPKGMLLLSEFLLLVLNLSLISGESPLRFLRFSPLMAILMPIPLSARFVHFLSFMLEIIPVTVLGISRLVQFLAFVLDPLLSLRVPIIVMVVMVSGVAAGREGQQQRAEGTSNYGGGSWGGFLHTFLSFCDCLCRKGSPCKQRTKPGGRIPQEQGRYRQGSKIDATERLACTWKSKYLPAHLCFPERDLQGARQGTREGNRFPCSGCMAFCHSTSRECYS